MCCMYGDHKSIVCTPYFCLPKNFDVFAAKLNFLGGELMFQKSLIIKYKLEMKDAQNAT